MELTKGEIATYGELHGQAVSAQRALRINYISQAMVDKGIISGSFGEARLQVAKLLSDMGMSTAETKEIVSNTEAYFKWRGRAVAETIKAFGSGTGLSDKDREYAQGIAAGDIALTKDAINKLLSLERKYAGDAIRANNEIIDRLGKIQGQDNWEVGKRFYLEIPEPPTATRTGGTGLSPAAQQYLEMSGQ